MKRVNTQGIILKRTNFSEADRILKFLTPDHGKVSAIAKGVRKSNSKLAGGIELFSISELTLLIGRSEIYTIISSRLINHYRNIVKDLQRTTTGYEFMRLINKTTEESTEPAYFLLLKSAFEALDDKDLDPQVTELWFNMQLLKLSGHTPNLQTDASGSKLVASAAYNFHLENMQFTPEKSKQGTFTANHIKFLRLGFAASCPQILHKVKDVEILANSTQMLVLSMIKNFIRI